MSHRPCGEAERQHLTEVLSFCPIREGSLGRDVGGKKASVSGGLEERKKRRMMEKYCSFPLDVI